MRPTHPYKADANFDGVINVTDLLAVLGGQDVTGDGVMTVKDVTHVLGNWNGQNPVRSAAPFLEDIQFPAVPAQGFQYIEGQSFPGTYSPPPGVPCIFRGCNFNEVRLDSTTAPCTWEDCSWINAPDETAVQCDGARDQRFIRPIMRGHGSEHAFDLSRKGYRWLIENPEIQGYAYGGFLSGTDVQWEGGLTVSSHKETPIRCRELSYFNIIGGEYIRSIKNAISIRRFCHHGAVINADLTGQLALGPDKVKEGPDWRTTDIRIVGTYIDTSGTNPDRPCVHYPTCDAILMVNNNYVDPENELEKGRGWLKVVPEAQGRQPGTCILGGSSYNGHPVSGPHGVDTDHPSLIHFI